MKHIKNIGQFLYDSGLLFEINRMVLHPRGLALEVSSEDEHFQDVEMSSIQDHRDDLTGLIFDPITLENGSKKLNQFDTDQGFSKRSNLRERILGFQIQPRFSELWSVSEEEFEGILQTVRDWVPHLQSLFPELDFSAGVFVSDQIIEVAPSTDVVTLTVGTHFPLRCKTCRRNCFLISKGFVTLHFQEELGDALFKQSLDIQCNTCAQGQ